MKPKPKFETKNFLSYNRKPNIQFGIAEFVVSTKMLSEIYNITEIWVENGWDTKILTKNGSDTHILGQKNVP